jgi:hypothetical protein
MRDSLDPLVKLRVSVARIAQQLGLDSVIPGASAIRGPMNFAQLTHAAQTEERGWNRLSAGISIAVERFCHGDDPRIRDIVDLDLPFRQDNDGD